MKQHTVRVLVRVVRLGVVLVEDMGGDIGCVVRENHVERSCCEELHKREGQDP